MKLEHETYLLIAEAAHLFLAEVAYIRPVNGDGARIGLVQCSHNLKQGGLSCSASSYYADDFSLLDVQVNTFEHLQFAEGFCYVSDLYHCVMSIFRK